VVVHYLFHNAKCGKTTLFLEMYSKGDPRISLEERIEDEQKFNFKQEL
jgi:hypothetical protein